MALLPALTGAGAKASDAIPVLAAMLGESSVQVRLAAANALVAISPDSKVCAAALLRAVGSKDRLVRTAITRRWRAVGVHADEKVVSSLRELAHVDDEAVCEQAKTALYELEVPQPW